jgi:hypothetical protein
MKKLLLLWVVLLCTAINAQNSKLVATCCDASASTAAKSGGRLSSEGEWLYVRVNGSGTNGWVNYKYVK